jgi:hypothetical protein
VSARPAIRRSPPTWAETAAARPAEPATALRSAPTCDGRAGSPVTTTAMRWMLLVAGGFVVIAGTQLFVLTGHTDRYFAWTVDQPLTAAFLGAGYWASAVLELGSARRRDWPRARFAMPAVLLFTTVTLAVTLIHLARFHLHSTFGIAWLVVYASFPPAMAAILTHQLRAAGPGPARSVPLPTLTRTVLVVQATVLAALAIALLLATDAMRGVWPWPLTPLTAHAIGAWLAGIAYLAIHVVAQDDCEHAQTAMLSYATFGALQLVALARYPTAPEWRPAGAAAYIAFLTVMVAIGTHTWARGRRASPASGPQRRSRARLSHH